MSTTRRGFLASVAALMGLGTAAKGGGLDLSSTVGDGKGGFLVPPEIKQAIINNYASYPTSGVMFFGGPADGERRQVAVAARTHDIPIRPVHIVTGSDNLVPVPGQYLHATYIRSTVDSNRFVYEGGERRHKSVLEDNLDNPPAFQ